MIRNLKSKLKAMSSSSPLHNQDLSSSAVIKNDACIGVDHFNPETPEHFEPIEVNRGNEIGVIGSTEARGALGGQIIETPDGCFVRKRFIYELDTTYGNINLLGLPASDFSDSEWWTRLEQSFHPKDIVFLDTETTGLAGGTGTYAFLIGLGYITDQGLVIEQYVMRDFDEEYPMLQSVIDTLKRFRVLVTFNGKSFDWPLLESRLIYSRLRTISWENAHLDLLHISRRLWGRSLDSCSLMSIEETILGNVREDDIPGSQIPQIYFEYLDSRDTEMMIRVMQHNEWDIAAMAALLLHVKSLYENPATRADAYELLGIAKELERNHRIQQASACYQGCIRKSNIHSLTLEAKKRLAYLTKKHEGQGEAMEIWADLARDEGSLLIFPLIEMAKYLEHRKKDFYEALKCTEKAILLAGMRSNGSFRLRDELSARRRRLIKKLERSTRQWG